MRHIEAKIKEKEMLILYWHARIVSGDYKNRKIYHGTNGPEFTDEEKLNDATAIMAQHISQLSELVEKFGNMPIKEER